MKQKRRNPARAPFTTSNQTEDKKIFKGFKLTEKGWQFIA